MSQFIQMSQPFALCGGIIDSRENGLYILWFTISLYVYWLWNMHLAKKKNKSFKLTPHYKLSVTQESLPY